MNQVLSQSTSDLQIIFLLHVHFIALEPHVCCLAADDRNAVRACDQISDLVDGLSTFLNPTHAHQYSLPQYLTRPVRSVIVGQYVASDTADVTVAVAFCTYSVAVTNCYKIV